MVVGMVAVGIMKVGIMVVDKVEGRAVTVLEMFGDGEWRSGGEGEGGDSGDEGDGGDGVTPVKKSTAAANTPTPVPCVVFPTIPYAGSYTEYRHLLQDAVCPLAAVDLEVKACAHEGPASPIPSPYSQPWSCSY